MSKILLIKVKTIELQLLGITHKHRTQGEQGVTTPTPQVDRKSYFSGKELHISGNILLFFGQILSFRDGNTLYFIYE